MVAAVSSYELFHSEELNIPIRELRNTLRGLQWMKAVCPDEFLQCVDAIRKHQDEEEALVRMIFLLLPLPYMPGEILLSRSFPAIITIYVYEDGEIARV